MNCKNRIIYATKQEKMKPTQMENCVGFQDFFNGYNTYLERKMRIMEYIAIPCIVVICYLFAEALKLFTGKNEIVKRTIPVVVGVIGAILGVLLFVYYPDFINSNNIFDSMAIGIISGLAATGSNQIIKQLLKGDKENAGEFF